MGGITKEIYDLAVIIHIRYETLSEEYGWKTQKQCRVNFDDLPEENKQVMFGIAIEVAHYFKNKINGQFINY